MPYIHNIFSKITMPGIPITLICILFFTAIFTFYLSKVNIKSKLATKAFWEKESQANSTRKADISNLDYIKIPLDNFPILDTADEKLANIQNSIKDLSEKPILNLTGVSNTDLKLKYGVANMNYLSVCDNNYTLLVRNLYAWGNYLYELDMKKEAITVLEFGIQCKTDISKNYILLANLYKDMLEDDKINDLLLVAMSLQSLTKDTIIKTLKEIL